MRKLLVPALLAALAAAQLIRIERVAAENPPPSQGGSLDSTRLVSFSEWIAMPRRDITAPDDAEEERLGIEVDSAADATTQAALSESLREEFEALAKLPYVIEPPDILTVTITPAPGKRLGFGLTKDGKATVASIELQCLVKMDGRIETLDHHSSVYVAGLTVEQARDALLATLKQDPGMFENVEDVAVSVLKTNSKVAYVVTQRRGVGDVTRVPVPFPLSADNNVGAQLKNIGLRGYTLAEAEISIVRPAPNGVGVDMRLPVAWDSEADAPTPESNYPVLPGDRIFVVAPADPPATNLAPPPPQPPRLRGKSVEIMLLNADETSIQWFAELANDQRMGEFLRGLKIPQRERDEPLKTLNPTGANIKLTRMFGPKHRDSHTTWAIGWDAAAGAPAEGDDRELQDGDSIVIDFRPPEPGATILPNPMPPAPQPDPASEAAPAATKQIEFSIAFIEDIDGDFAEFAGAEGDVEVAIRDAATLEPALRVLERHDHIKRLATPRIKTELGRSAEFNTAVPVPGGDRLFRTQYQARVLAHRPTSETRATAYKIEVAALAHHDKKKFSIDCGFMLREGQTAVARLQSESGDAGPIYVVVTPRAHD